MNNPAACEVSGMVVIRSVQVMMSSDHSSTNWEGNSWDAPLEQGYMQCIMYNV
jgi:hypothetical protein